MSPDFEKLSLFHYFLPLSSEFFDTDHITTLLKILSIRKINIAVKYDYYWTDLDFNPDSDDEVGDLVSYCQRNGKVINKHPFVWYFQRIEPLIKVANGFINANQMVFTHTESSFDYSSIISGTDNDIAAFWKVNVPYFLIGIDDHCGFYFVSSSEKEILCFKKDFQGGQ